MMRWGCAIAVLEISWLSFAGGAEPTVKDDLARAVAAMLNVNAAALTQEAQDAKEKELDQAWKTLVRAGSNGATVLKEQIMKLEASKEKDDFFMLGAAAILWQIGKVNEADTIAELWSRATTLTDNYNYVFFTAFDAARTQDPRVLPMLIVILRDQKGDAFVSQHCLTINWPLSHIFIWGAFGSKGTPALLRVLEESKDETTLASAVLLLAMTQDYKALEKIRVLATQGHGIVRTEAIKALGRFGHPQDFDFLVAGLKGKDTAEVRAFAYALYEYGDLRAVPNLIPLLHSKDDELAREAIGCVAHLTTAEGIEAIQTCVGKMGNKQRNDDCKTAVTTILEPLNLTYKAYAAKTLQERRTLAASLRDRNEDKYRLKPKDRKLTHDELLKAAAEWKTRNRISGGTYEWVEDRHVMAAATADDIPLLIDVTAACYLRLSDECLYEVESLKNLIQRLGRSRYRREVGVCEKVELVKGSGK